MKKGSLLRLCAVNSNQGSVMLLSLIVAVFLSILGLTFFTFSINDTRLTERHRQIAQAFRNAEAGIERAIFDLRQDFILDPTPSWSDRDINGIAIPGQRTDDFYDLPYLSTSLNEGQYTVQLRNVPESDREIWIRSVGLVADVRQTIQVYVRIRDVSIWNNAIFAGAGQSGLVINGNSRIWGSAHMLGDNLTSEDLAVDLSGSAILAGNNYSDLAQDQQDQYLLAKIPSIKIKIGENEIDTLNSELRIKNGQVGLSGDATTGEPDDPATSIKETMDGAYVTDGYGGNQGTNNVFSDNGFYNGYDLGDALNFPSVSAPYGDKNNYQAYLEPQALVLTNELSNIQPTSTFTYSDGKNSIVMKDGNMHIEGIIVVKDNNDLGMYREASNQTISYRGSGSIFVTGKVEINTDLITMPNRPYPENIIGIMTPNSISFNGAQTDIMGLFYAEGSVILSKQTNILGTIVSNYFDMGTNVPSIFQVPATASNLPPGMIDPGPLWLIQTISWERL